MGRERDTGRQYGHDGFPATPATDESPGRLIQLGVDGTKLAQPLVDTEDFRVGGPMTPSELAADLITSRAGTTKRIYKLLSAGLVTGESTPRDGRGALIRMTEAGRERQEMTMLLRGLLLHVEGSSR
ncbi:hypothetical protein GCM10023063_24370 [Arthrobacter methylotrophus]|uniref:HTH marR-type domain-containing protein n=1 Tax=Arthrobacter methylotrophus TaxID=121291 RepID=A0ABV5UPI4_9MICC